MNKLLTTKLKTLNINIDDYKKVDGILTDPATVIAIAETAKKIYDMFAKKKQAPSEELKYLKRIIIEYNTPHF